MFLQTKQTGTLVKIVDLESLFNPNRSSVTAKDQAGQEEQDPETFEKTQLIFPSGEDLPRCWLDANYRQN
jgi:hypothetical protein